MNPTTTPAPSAPVITEAAVLAFFAQVNAQYAPQFPELREFKATCGFGTEVGFFGYTNDRYDTAQATGPTFAEAATKLRTMLGTPESKAAKLREEASKMLAEADRITGT
jgi:hypothetical protein